MLILRKFVIFSKTLFSCYFRISIFKLITIGYDYEPHYPVVDFENSEVINSKVFSTILWIEQYTALDHNNYIGSKYVYHWENSLNFGIRDWDISL